MLAINVPTVTLQEVWQDFESTPSYVERYQREREQREAQVRRYQEEAEQRAMHNLLNDPSGSDLNIW